MIGKKKYLTMVFCIILISTILTILSYNTVLYSADTIDNAATTEIPELTCVDEEALEFQQINGKDFEAEGQAVYNRAINNIVNSKLGSKKELTYYSQIDSRWKNILYTSTGNKNQTIGSSGCGPTSAAIVVSGIKGTVLPPEMAKIYVDNGFRSANNGTYLSAFSWTANVFNIPYQETYYLDTAVNFLKNNNYIIVSVGEGLFTTGGHLMVIAGIDGNTLKIYDPYLYAGKFDTPDRRGKVTVIGNTVYCSIDNFRKYANYSHFFAFQNDGNNTNGNGNGSNTAGYTRYVDTASNAGVNVRSGPGSNYSRVTGYSDGTKVTVYETQGNWSRVGNSLWICSDYLVEIYSGNVGHETFDNYNVKVITKNGLNIRKGASTNYTKIGTYGYGKVITIIAQSGNWGRTADGWICLDYTERTANYAVKAVTAKSGLNVRAAASANSRIVATYKYGTQVKVYSTQNGWCKVNGGYMYAAYLK